MSAPNRPANPSNPANRREGPVLALHDLTVGYRPHRRPPIEVVARLTTSVAAGEMVCLVGPNGSGKSTLLRTIAAVQPALGGEVLLGGDDVARLAPLERARRLAVVLTERPDVGMMTGRELVALGRHPHTGWTGALGPHDEEAVDAALAQTASGALAGRQVTELSDGQRQRLMIARALAQEPAVMLLDEPTAFLDVTGRVELTGLLRHLAHESSLAVVLSTHDLDLALRVADLLWLLDAGGRLHVGTAEELVLAGRLEAAFGGDGIRFDAEQGSFRPRRTTVGRAVVHGEGLAALLARRALEREGYEVLDPATNAPTGADLVVEAEANGADPRWRAEAGGQSAGSLTFRELSTFARRHLEEAGRDRAP